MGVEQDKPFRTDWEDQIIEVHPVEDSPIKTVHSDTPLRRRVFIRILKKGEQESYPK